MKADYFKKATFHREKAITHLQLFLDHLQKANEVHQKELEKKPIKRTYNKK